MAMTMQQCKDHMALSEKAGVKKDSAMMKKDAMCNDLMNKDGGTTKGAWRRAHEEIVGPKVLNTGAIMKINTVCMVALALGMASGAASAKGCLEGAAVGGVVGHVAGKHGVLGAAGGCAVGSHEANKKEKQQAAQAQAAQASPPPAAAPATSPSAETKK